VRSVAKGWAMKVLGVAGLLALILAGFGLGCYTVYDWVWGRESHLRAAKQALERRDFAGAAEHLEVYLEARPRSAEAHLLAARTARRALVPILPVGDGLPPPWGGNAVGSFDKAEKHLAAYRKLGGVPELARFERHLLRAQCGDLAAVEADLLAWVQQGHPDALLILEALAKAYLIAYRLLEAQQCLSQWLERQEDAQPLLWRGWVRQRLSDTSNALKDYRRALELQPEHDEAELRLADLLEDFSQPKEALKHFRRLGQRQPDAPAVLLGQARCHYTLGEAEEARRLLDRLLARHPEDVEALIEYGNLELQEQQPARAEFWFRKAVRQEPFNHLANYRLYLSLQKGGKKEEARECQLKLEGIEADMTRMEEVSRKVMLRPKDPWLRYEAGALLLCNGQEEGLRWLDSALQEDPRHPPTRALLADYSRWGRQKGDSPFYQNTHDALADYYEHAGQADLATHHRRRARQIGFSRLKGPIGGVFASAPLGPLHWLPFLQLSPEEEVGESGRREQGASLPGAFPLPTP
jgi:tetratricopeptide (TPR) repeat protein